MTGRSSEAPRAIGLRRYLAGSALVLAAWAPAAAQAQINIDQGKAPAQIFASDCGVCHKTTRGLANGRSGGSLAAFLSEHYTSSSREASELAAYVLASGGAGPAPATRSPKPDNARAAPEQPTTREARRPVKPDEQPSANPKPPRTAVQSRKPDSEPRKPDGVRSATAEPEKPGSGRKPSPGRRELNPSGASRPAAKPAEAAPAEAPTNPAPAANAPPANTAADPQRSAEIPASPSPDAGRPSADASPATPVEAQPSDASPVPRDNIPD